MTARTSASLSKEYEKIISIIALPFGVGHKIELLEVFFLNGAYNMMYLCPW